jgi:hypothetical protein
MGQPGRFSVSYGRIKWQQPCMIEPLWLSAAYRIEFTVQSSAILLCRVIGLLYCIGPLKLRPGIDSYRQLIQSSFLYRGVGLLRLAIIRCHPLGGACGTIYTGIASFSIAVI